MTKRDSCSQFTKKDQLSGLTSNSNGFIAMKMKPNTPHVRSNGKICIKKLVTKNTLLLDSN